MSTTPTRPVVRYHGGKWRLAPWIVSFFPEHAQYTEAFGGGGSVLLRKRPVGAELYNDLDADVVNLFRVLRDERQAEDLQRLLRLTPFAREEFEAAYLPAADPVERARRFIVRSAMGRSSAAHNPEQRTGFRWKAGRQGTALPVNWGRYPDALRAVVQRLRLVVIENRDAVEVLRGWDDVATLHYVDPPYPHSTRHGENESNAAYRFEMTDEEHRELAEVLRSLRGMVILSGYACPLYDADLYRDWERHECRTIKSTNNGSAPATEVLWINPAAARARAQQSLFAA
jgi:DNA adenine methylase